MSLIALSGIYNVATQAVLRINASSPDRTMPDISRTLKHDVVEFSANAKLKANSSVAVTNPNHKAKVFPLAGYDIRECLVDMDNNPLTDLIEDEKFLKQLEQKVNKYKISKDELSEYIQFRGADILSEMPDDIELINCTVSAYSPFNAMHLTLLDKMEIADAMRAQDANTIIQVIERHDENAFVLDGIGTTIWEDVTKLEKIAKDKENAFIALKNAQNDSKYEILEVNGQKVPVYVKGLSKYNGKIYKKDLLNLIKSNMLTKELANTKVIDFSNVPGYKDEITVDIFSANGKKIENVSLGETIEDIINKVKNGENLTSYETHALTDWFENWVEKSIEKNSKGEIVDYGDFAELEKDPEIMAKAKTIKSVIESMKSNAPEYEVDDHFYMRMIDRGITHAFSTSGEPLDSKKIEQLCVKTIKESGKALNKGAQGEVYFMLNADQPVKCKYKINPDNGKIILDTIIAD